MNTDSYNQLKTRVLNIMWQEKDFDTAGRQVLELVGRAFSADSAYISEYSESEHQFINTYLWTITGLQGSTRKISRADQEVLSEQQIIFHTGIGTVFRSVDTLPAEAGALMYGRNIERVS